MRSMVEGASSSVFVERWGAGCSGLRVADASAPSNAARSPSPVNGGGEEATWAQRKTPAVRRGR